MTRVPTPSWSHRVALVVDRYGRTGELVDLVHLYILRERHVVVREIEAQSPMRSWTSPGRSSYKLSPHVGVCEQTIAQVTR